MKINHLFGTKLAFEVSKNAVIGAMSGSVMGLGDSLVNNERPIETMLRYAVISSAIGAGLGAIGVKTVPIITSAINKSKNVKIAVDFLENGKISENLENITVTIEDLAKQMPELKSFAEKTKGTKINFSKDLGTNGGIYNHKTDTITYNIEYIENSFYHELQHAVDIKYIKSHPENRDLQIILKSGEKVNSMEKLYREYHKDIFIKYEKFLKQPDISEIQFDKLFTQQEKKIIKIWYNDYVAPYYEHILEVRARETQMKGIKHERGIEEVTNELRRNSTEWDKYEK